MRRSERGFTLLEVMAAVAIVAIVFTTLARVASQGLRSEGTSKRRLEASLLADATLSEIEAQVASGVAPALGSSEREEGLFRVGVEVTPFDLAASIPLGDEAAGGIEGGGLGGAGSSPDESPIRQIEVRVAWDEGVEEMRVTRTTFGIDQIAIQNLLGSVIPAEPSGDAGEAVP